MFDKEKIPEPLLLEMHELFGEVKTEEIARSVGYNYQRLYWAVLNEKFKRKFGVRLFVPFIGALIIIHALWFYLEIWY
jgi:hypothetical protein